MPLPDEHEYRRSVLFVVLTITILSSACFSLLNWLAWPEYKTFALIQAAVVLLWTGILSVIKKTRYLKHWSMVFLFTSYCLVFYSLMNVSFRVGLFSWIFIFPVLSYLLLGRRVGMITTFIGVFGGLGVLGWRVWQQDPEVHWIALGNYGACTLAIWAMAHVYEFKRASVVRRLQNMATKDPLTGLLNVRTLFDTLDSTLTDTKQRSEPVTAVYIDINDFKVINDTHGHQRGNDILITVAKAIKNATRKVDHLFRYGGDEFVIIFPNCTEQQARSICEHRLASELREKEADLTLSIGYAQTGINGYLSPDTLLQQADHNMYEVKRTSKQH